MSVKEVQVPSIARKQGARRCGHGNILFVVHSNSKGDSWQWPMYDRYIIRMSLVKNLLDGVEETDRKLGGGGYASVFLGKWNGSQVAVKHLHPTLMGLDENSRPSEAFQRFMEEYPTLRTLTHPSIVQVYGMVKPSSPQGSYGVVMELLPTTLKKRYGQEPALRWSQEVSVLISISSGVEYLHSKGILHRDITTSNVMLTERGAGTEWLSAKIVDVGVARALDDLTREEQTLSLEPGADRYMAPEVLDPVDDQVARYGKPADIFSVGVTTLAMCLKREPPRLAVICREGHDSDMADMDEDHPLYGTLVQCLARDSSIRPSASQLCEDLKETWRLCSNGIKPLSGAGVGDSSVGSEGELAALKVQLDRVVAERDQALSALEKALRDNEVMARVQGSDKAEHDYPGGGDYRYNQPRAIPVRESTNLRRRNPAKAHSSSDQHSDEAGKPSDPDPEMQQIIRNSQLPISLGRAIDNFAQDRDDEGKLAGCRQLLAQEGTIPSFQRLPRVRTFANCSHPPPPLVC